MDLQRFEIKLFAAEGEGVELALLIPVFHRWIQTRAVEGMLIDVADYSHVVDGPGILLVAHEANYALDETGGRRGFLYSRKQPLDGTLAERLFRAAEIALRACRELESAPELGGRLRFRGDEIRVIANDRLAAPNTEETWRAFEPELRAFLERLQPGVPYEVVRAESARERFAVTVKLANGRLRDHLAA
jgi:hypothetical protein